MFLYIWTSGYFLYLCQVHVKWDMYMYVKDALDMPWIQIYTLIILFFFVWRSTYFDFKIQHFVFCLFFVLNSSSVWLAVGLFLLVFGGNYHTDNASVLRFFLYTKPCYIVIHFSWKQFFFSKSFSWYFLSGLFTLVFNNKGVMWKYCFYAQV